MTDFIVTIDTEEEGRWRGDYDKNGTVSNIEKIPSFQSICDIFKIKPTYLMTYPVATNENSVEILKNILIEKKCEIGAHLHPWNTPPFKEPQNKKFTYANNLPFELEKNKLANLASAIENSFGIKPVSYRAGRYGIDEDTIKILEELDFQVDTSVVPNHKEMEKGGPCFFHAPSQPYTLSHKNILKRGESKILEIPVSTAFNKKAPKLLRQIYVKAPRKLHIKGLLSKLKILKLYRLRPSSYSLEEMKYVVGSFIKAGFPALNMMFHSSELLPGASPYNKTERDVEAFLNKVEKIFDFIMKKNNLMSKTLAEFRRDFVL